MTSGGIIHEEMPRRGPSGLVNGFQLWVNLPAALKMRPPRYQEVKADRIPTLDHNGRRVRLVAGHHAGGRGPVSEIAAAPLYMDVRLEPGSEFTVSTPRDHTALAYVFEGEFGLGVDGRGERVEAVRMLVFGQGDELRVRAGETPRRASS